MLGKCFFVIVVLSLVSGLLTGNMAALGNAALDGAAKAIEVTLSLAGMTVLWCGVMRVLSECGAVRLLTRVLTPLLKPIFPSAWKNPACRDAVTAAVTANMLGLGNAATPLALTAMRTLGEDAGGEPPEATDDMVTFAVLGTAPLNLLPGTLIAMRRAAGSAAPYAIVVPVWICSFLCALFGVLLARLGNAAGRKGRMAAAEAVDGERQSTAKRRVVLRTTAGCRSGRTR